MKKRLLITGASGMLGATLSKHFLKDFEIFSTGTKNLHLDDVKNFMEFDLSSKDYSKLIDWSKPDIIIHAAALTNGNFCEQNPEMAFDINGISLQRFCKILKPDTHLIYVSTDAVFSNEMHLAKESDCVQPESIYGKSKEIGEFFLRNSESNYTIVRTTIVGKNLNPMKQGFVEWIVNSAKNATEISLFDDVKFTPISIWSLADQLQYIIENPKKFSREIVHVAGSEICTKYEFGMALLKTLNLRSDKIQRGRIADFADRAKRSTDQTMNCEKFIKLSQRTLPDLKDTISDIKSSYDDKH